MSTLSRFAAESERRHAEQVAAGKHDRLCEYGLRVYGGDHPGESFNHMCHCPMRWRLAHGSTVLPGEVEWNAPSCPICGDNLGNDGDSWNCLDCHVQWGQDGAGASWTDEYGDLGKATS